MSDAPDEITLFHKWNDGLTFLNNKLNSRTPIKYVRADLAPDIGGLHCACVFENDECLDACCYHTDLEVTNKRLALKNEELRILIGIRDNELMLHTTPQGETGKAIIEQAIRDGKAAYKTAQTITAALEASKVKP